MEEGTSGAGFARLLVVDFVFVAGRELRFAFTERAGLGFVRFGFVIFMESGVGRLGGLVERP